MSTTLSLRVPYSTKLEIEELARVSNRKKSDLLLNWINEKLDIERWQIEEIHKGLEEADAGIFASEEDSIALRKKWLG